jgi:hypothetical protein
MPLKGIRVAKEENLRIESRDVDYAADLCLSACKNCLKMRQSVLGPATER